MNDSEIAMDMDLDQQIQMAIQFIHSQPASFKKARVGRRKDSIELFFKKSELIPSLAMKTLPPWSFVTISFKYGHSYFTPLGFPSPNLNIGKIYNQEFAGYSAHKHINQRCLPKTGKFANFYWVWLKLIPRDVRARSLSIN